MTPIQSGMATALFAFTFYAVAMNASTRGWIGWYEISMEGKGIEATITKVQPEIHRRCYFQYTVNEKLYDGLSDGCSDLNIGSKISVLYLPSDPSFVTTREPKGELFLMIFAPLLLSSLAGIVAFFRRSKRLARDLT